MSGLVTVADISNYTGTLTAEQAEGLATAVEHVIVRISLESEELAAITRQQLAVLRAAGVSVSGYLFPEYDADPATFIVRALGLAGPVRTLWIDVEPPGLPSAAVIQDWIRRAAAVSPVPVGIYTGAWVIWQLPGWEPMDLPLWSADYTNEPPASLAVSYGGWSQAAGIQYRADTVIAGVLCDLSVFDTAALVV